MLTSCFRRCSYVSFMNIMQQQLICQKQNSNFQNFIFYQASELMDKQEAILQNKFLNHCLRTLLHRLLHEFRSQSYNVNSLLKTYYQSIVQAELPKQQRIKTKTTSESEQNVEWLEEQKKQVKQIWSQISMFIWQLSCTPKTIVFMLQNEQIHADETDSIDMHIFTTKIYQQFFAKLSGRTEYGKVFQQFVSDQIYFFLEEVCSQICQTFSRGQEIIVEEVTNVTEKVKKSAILNFYLLFKLFKDVSHICQNKISFQLSEGIFKNIQSQVVELFVNYILEKYEVLKFQMGDESQSRVKIPFTEKILSSKKVKWREAIRQDGEIGVLIEIEEEQTQENYLVQFSQTSNDVKVMNCNSIRRKWMVCKKAEENFQIVKLVKNKKAFVERMRDSPPNINSMTVIDNLNILGGTMGRCLAEIDKYKNLGHFMADLSRRTLVGGSMSYMINAVPLLGYLFISGGFTYSFYYIFSNKYANKTKKLQDLGNMAIGTTASLGSGLLGAAVGQMLIPIPGFGAFVGGFVGGFLGQFGGRKLCDILESVRSKQIQIELENTIQPKGYWDVNKRTLNILGINKEKFYETIPTYLQQKMNCDRLWLTLIFFTLLSFFESKKRMKFMEKKLKEMEEKHKKLSEYQIIEENERSAKKGDYEPSIDFMCTFQYIEESCILFIECFEDLEFIIMKMFSRLK